MILLVTLTRFSLIIDSFILFLFFFKLRHHLSIHFLYHAVSHRILFSLFLGCYFMWGNYLEVVPMPIPLLTIISTTTVAVAAINNMAEHRSCAGFCQEIKHLILC